MFSYEGLPTETHDGTGTQGCTQGKICVVGTAFFFKSDIEEPNTRYLKQS